MRGFVEDKVSLNTTWNIGEWSTLLSLRYLSSLTEQCAGNVFDFGLGPELCSNAPDPDVVGTNKMDSTVYADLQVAWHPAELFGGGWGFAAGVQNLTDEEAPICYSCDLNSMDGTIYPIEGQFWYLRASFQN